MLIFDRFPSRAKAEQFATTVEKEFGLATQICESQQESDRIAPFPFRLALPIVLVKRPEGYDMEDLLKEERVVEERVRTFGGIFAGT